MNVDDKMINKTMNKIDVIVIGDHYFDVNLSYVKKNRDLVNHLYVLAECMEGEITTYISKINRVGMEPGEWSFYRILDAMGSQIDHIFNKSKTDVVVLDDSSKHGIFEKIRKENAEQEEERESLV